MHRYLMFSLTSIHAAGEIFFLWGKNMSSGSLHRIAAIVVLLSSLCGPLLRTMRDDVRVQSTTTTRSGCRSHVDIREVPSVPSYPSQAPRQPPLLVHHHSDSLVVNDVSTRSCRVAATGTQQLSEKRERKKRIPSTAAVSLFVAATPIDQWPFNTPMAHPILTSTVLGRQAADSTAVTTDTLVVPLSNTRIRSETASVPGQLVDVKWCRDATNGGGRGVLVVVRGAESGVLLSRYPNIRPPLVANTEDSDLATTPSAMAPFVYTGAETATGVGAQCSSDGLGAYIVMTQFIYYLSFPAVYQVGETVFPVESGVTAYPVTGKPSPAGITTATVTATDALFTNIQCSVLIPPTEYSQSPDPPPTKDILLFVADRRIYRLDQTTSVTVVIGIDSTAGERTPGTPGSLSGKIDGATAMAYYRSVGGKLWVLVALPANPTAGFARFNVDKPLDTTYTLEYPAAAYSNSGVASGLLTDVLTTQVRFLSAMLVVTDSRRHILLRDGKLTRVVYSTDDTTDALQITLEVLGSNAVAYYDGARDAMRHGSDASPTGMAWVQAPRTVGVVVQPEALWLTTDPFAVRLHRAARPRTSRPYEDFYHVAYATNAAPPSVPFTLDSNPTIAAVSNVVTMVPVIGSSADVVVLTSSHIEIFDAHRGKLFRIAVSNPTAVAAVECGPNWIVFYSLSTQILRLEVPRTALAAADVTHTLVCGTISLQSMAPGTCFPDASPGGGAARFSAPTALALSDLASPSHCPAPIGGGVSMADADRYGVGHALVAADPSAQAPSSARKPSLLYVMEVSSPASSLSQITRPYSGTAQGVDPSLAGSKREIVSSSTWSESATGIGNSRYLVQLFGPRSDTLVFYQAGGTNLGEDASLRAIKLRWINDVQLGDVVERDVMYTIVKQDNIAGPACGKSRPLQLLTPTPLGNFLTSGYGPSCGVRHVTMPATPSAFPAEGLIAPLIVDVGGSYNFDEMRAVLSSTGDVLTLFNPAVGSGSALKLYQSRPKSELWRKFPGFGFVDRFERPGVDPPDVALGTAKVWRIAGHVEYEHSDRGNPFITAMSRESATNPFRFITCEFTKRTVLFGASTFWIMEPGTHWMTKWIPEMKMTSSDDVNGLVTFQISGAASTGNGELFYAVENVHVVDTLDTTAATLAHSRLLGVAGYAGTEEPFLFSPHGLAMDRHTRVLYVAERLAHRVISYSVELLTRSVVVGVAGSPGEITGMLAVARLSFPSALQFDSYRSQLYIVSSHGRKILRYDLTLQALNLLAGSIADPDPMLKDGESATFAKINDILLSPLGQMLYIADSCYLRFARPREAILTVTTLGNGQRPCLDDIPSNEDGFPLATFSPGSLQSLGFSQEDGTLLLGIGRSNSPSAYFARASVMDISSTVLIGSPPITSAFRPPVNATACEPTAAYGALVILTDDTGRRVVLAAPNPDTTAWNGFFLWSYNRADADRIFVRCPSVGHPSCTGVVAMLSSSGLGLVVAFKTCIAVSVPSGFTQLFGVAETVTPGATVDLVTPFLNIATGDCASSEAVVDTNGMAARYASIRGVYATGSGAVYVADTCRIVKLEGDWVAVDAGQDTCGCSDGANKPPGTPLAQFGSIVAMQGYLIPPPADVSVIYVLEALRLRRRNFETTVTIAGFLCTDSMPGGMFSEWPFLDGVVGVSRLRNAQTLAVTPEQLYILDSYAVRTVVNPTSDTMATVITLTNFDEPVRDREIRTGDGYTATLGAVTYSQTQPPPASMVIYGPPGHLLISLQSACELRQVLPRGGWPLFSISKSPAPSGPVRPQYFIDKSQTPTHPLGQSRRSSRRLTLLYSSTFVMPSLFGNNATTTPLPSVFQEQPAASLASWFGGVFVGNTSSGMLASNKTQDTCDVVAVVADRDNRDLWFAAHTTTGGAQEMIAARRVTASALPFTGTTTTALSPNQRVPIRNASFDLPWSSIAWYGMPLWFDELSVPPTYEQIAANGAWARTASWSTSNTSSRNVTVVRYRVAGSDQGMNPAGGQVIAPARASSFTPAVVLVADTNAGCIRVVTVAAGDVSPLDGLACRSSATATPSDGIVWSLLPVVWSSFLSTSVSAALNVPPASGASPSAPTLAFPRCMALVDISLHPTAFAHVDFGLSPLATSTTTVMEPMMFDRVARATNATVALLVTEGNSMGIAAQTGFVRVVLLRLSTLDPNAPPFATAIGSFVGDVSDPTSATPRPFQSGTSARSTVLNNPKGVAVHHGNSSAFNKPAMGSTGAGIAPSPLLCVFVALDSSFPSDPSVVKIIDGVVISVLVAISAALPPELPSTGVFPSTSPRRVESLYVTEVAPALLLGAGAAAGNASVGAMSNGIRLFLQIVSDLPDGESVLVSTALNVSSSGVNFSVVNDWRAHAWTNDVTRTQHQELVYDVCVVSGPDIWLSVDSDGLLMLPQDPAKYEAQPSPSTASPTYALTTNGFCGPTDRVCQTTSVLYLTEITSSSPPSSSTSSAATSNSSSDESSTTSPFPTLPQQNETAPNVTGTPIATAPPGSATVAEEASTTSSNDLLATTTLVAFNNTQLATTSTATATFTTTVSTTAPNTTVPAPPTLRCAPAALLESDLASNSPPLNRRVVVNVLGDTFRVFLGDTVDVGTVSAAATSRIFSYFSFTPKSRQNPNTSSRVGPYPSSSGPYGATARFDKLFSAQSVVGVNATHVTLEFAVDNALFLVRDDNITMFMDQEAFTKASASSRSTDQFFTFAVQHTPRSVVSEAVASSAQTVVASAAGLGSIAAVNGANAAQMARSVAILDLAECTVDLEEAPERTVYPIGVPITSEVTRYYIGAMLLNPALIIVVACIHFSVADFLADRYRETRREGMARARFPSLTLVPFMFFSQDTISATFVTILHTTALPWRIIGGFLAGVWALFFLGLGLLFSNHFGALMTLPPSLWKAAYLKNKEDEKRRRNRRRRLEERRRLEQEAAQKKLGHQAQDDHEPNCLMYFFFGNEEWEDNDFFDPENRGFVKRFGTFFTPYRRERYWFLLIEFAVVYGMGVATAIKPNDGNCGNVSIAVVIILGVYSFALIGLRPHVTLWDSITTTLMAVGQFTAALFILLTGVALGLEYLLGYAQLLVISVMYFGGVKTAVDLVLMVYELVENCCAKSENDEEHQEEENGESETASDDVTDARVDVGDRDADPLVSRSPRGGHAPHDRHRAADKPWRKRPSPADDDFDLAVAAAVLVPPRRTTPFTSVEVPKHGRSRSRGDVSRDAIAAGEDKSLARRKKRDIDSSSDDSSDGGTRQITSGVKQRKNPRKTAPRMHPSHGAQPRTGDLTGEPKGSHRASRDAKAKARRRAREIFSSSSSDGI